MLKKNNSKQSTFKQCIICVIYISTVPSSGDHVKQTKYSDTLNATFQCLQLSFKVVCFINFFSTKYCS